VPARICSATAGSLAANDTEAAPGPVSSTLNSSNPSREKL
jgi:hypothetical protein